ncbi:hypothetical protein [Tychonema sp. BBK16]|nr:hypothetical protein [Tychonema sp. BBK16]
MATLVVKNCVFYLRGVTLMSSQAWVGGISLVIFAIDRSQKP